MKKNYRILIIDDDPTLLLIAQKKLQTHGYQLLTAATGEQGIADALEKSPDLLLLDYELPDMTGLDVCNILRNQPSYGAKPILFIAGKNDYESIDRAFQAGATDFIIKPLNWPILQYRIQYMLRAHEIQLSLLSSEARLAKAQRLAKLVNWEYNHQEKNFQWSETFKELFEINDYGSQNFNLADFTKRVFPDDLYQLENSIHNLIQRQLPFEIEHRIITDQGLEKVVLHVGHFIKNELNNHCDYIGTLQDITERIQSENKIRSLAYFDSLTGLKNRESFITVLNTALAENKKNHSTSALLFIDLDDFKHINDTLGHDVGDLLLCKISERLKNCVRTAENDQQFAPDNSRKSPSAYSDKVNKLSPLDMSRFDLARLGGDEFTVFLSDIQDNKVAATVSHRLLQALNIPFTLNNHEVFVSFSIGIALFPNDGDNVQQLLKNADVAMYHAKECGKNNFQFYQRSMSDKSLYRLSLESDLRNALSNNELYLVYQPLYQLANDRLIGCEALLRWKRPEKGLLMPEKFIPLAEQTGQILVIGQWLFEQISIILEQWLSADLLNEDFKIAVNVSSLQFHQANIIDKVKSSFVDKSLNQYVTFELTETVMMQNAAQNLTKLNLLSDLHINLSIDDFGTGYSSLSYLHQFPVKSVKIDRSFIIQMENEDLINIVKAIIAMAHGINIKVVAEGIENQQQLDFLKQLGCDIGQGFFLSEPLSLSEFQILLQQHRST